MLFSMIAIGGDVVVQSRPVMFQMHPDLNIFDAA